MWYETDKQMSFELLDRRRLERLEACLDEIRQRYNLLLKEEDPLYLQWLTEIDDRIDTEDIPMCKTIARETVKALEYIISELEKADPGDNVAQNHKRLYKILLAKWNKKLEELE